MSGLRRLGIDEIALRKGHKDFVVVFTDLDQHTLIGMAPARTHAAIKPVLETWGPEVLSKIEEVSIDLSGNYRGLVRRMMPNADIVADRFHVMKIVNQELNQLSFQERNKIHEEVHGVDTFAVEETPVLIESSLREMEQALHGIPSKDAFDQAMVMQSPYIQNRELWLKYLRADLFDPAAAALRMTKHLDLLLYFYGTTALQRPLQYSDLTDEEKAFCKTGAYQILPSRDRVGRLILFVHLSKVGNAYMRIRMQLYMGAVMMEDMESQRNGHVVISYQEPGMLAVISSPDYQSKIQDAVRYMPVRIAAVHLCLPDDPIVNIIRPMITLIIQSKKERCRTKFYTGLSMETRYKIMSFGIPANEIPVSSTMTIKTKNHLQWIKIRMAIEKARNEGKDTSAWIVHPNIHDILFSPGGNPSNQGNLEFRRMMDARLDEYFATTKRKIKKEIRGEISATARANGSRFIELNRKGGWWEELKNPEAVDEKVSVYFYNQKKKADAMGRRQNEPSETFQFLHGGAKRQKVDGEGSMVPCFGFGQ